VTRRGAIVAAALTLLAVWAWRSQLFVVSRPGVRPRPLVLLAPERRVLAAFDATLPAVPVGMEHLAPGHGALLLHYWAPWERHGLAQAQALDSLRRLLEPAPPRIALVCFDPFPSVARFVGRNRLRLLVVLDGERQLSRSLPCPSIPFTYVIDAGGRIAAAQAGEVDWLGPGTRAALRSLAEEVVVPAPATRLVPRPPRGRLIPARGGTSSST